MKALILAAGFGTRLQSIYHDTPKQLISVAGKFIIDYILDNLNNVKEIDEIYIGVNNLYYSKFEAWLKTKNNPKLKLLNNGVNSNEGRLGSVGDIHFIVQQANIADDLMVLGGDNILGFQLTELVSTFNKTRQPIVAAYDVNDKEQAKKYGVLEVEGSRITEFIEKPKEPKSTLSSTLVYLFPKETVPLIKQYMDAGLPPDRSGYYIAWLLTQTTVNAFIFEGTWFDIGSPDQLKEAEEKLK
ncbi:MAG: NDP-sugar synthase [Candidatus Nanoarchaeia archaeon]